MWELSQILCLVLLSILSIIDIRCRKVPEALLIIGNLGAIWYQLVVKNTDVWLMAAAVCIGMVFLLVSRVTKEEIGYGDSWGILILGIFMGIWGMLEVLLTAFLLLIVAAVLCFVRGKLSRNTTLPFYPFLTAGYFLVVFWGIV